MGAKGPNGQHGGATDSTSRTFREFYERDGAQRNHWLDKETEVYVQLDNLRYDQIFRPLQGPYPRAADLGCGSGVVASRLVPISEMALAVDLTSVRLGQVRRSVPGARLLQGDICSLPLRDESLDLAVVSEVIEHLPDYRPALQEIARVLRPGGTCVLSVPYRQDVEQHVCPHCLRSFPLHGHLHSFDSQSARRVLEDAGLRPESFASLNNTVATKIGKLFDLPYPLLHLLDRALRRMLPHLNHHLVVFSRKEAAPCRAGTSADAARGATRRGTN